MDALEFVVNKYATYLDEIEQVVKPELISVVEKMKDIDPHDLVNPETFFINEIHARGYIWSLFLETLFKKMTMK